MNTLLFFTVFIGLGALYFVIGIFSSRNINNVTDYFLAGRNLGIFSVTATLIATQIGGGMIIGTAEKAYHHGIYGILYTLGMSIGFLFLGSGIAGKLQALKIHTVSEIFDKCYKSENLQIIGSLLSIITFSGILTGQIVALKSLLIGLGLNNQWAFVGFWTFIMAYTIIGGLHAVVVTDMIQVFIIISMFAGIFIYNIMQEPAEFFTWNYLSQFQDQFIPPGFSLARLLPVVLTPALFSMIQQDLAQRFFASKTRSVATTSALISGLFLLSFSIIPIYFGMKSRLFGLGAESALTEYLSLTTNEFVLVFAICALIAAITSTADSLLCSISLHLTKDFSSMFTGIKDNLATAQYFTLATGITTFIASYFVPQDVIDIIISSYEISVSCMFVPIFASYFKTKWHYQAAWGGVLGGLLGYLVLPLIGMKVEAPREVISIIISCVGYAIGELIARRSS